VSRQPSTAARPAPIPAGEACVLCGVRLETPFAITRGLCDSCADRPEVKRVPKPGATIGTRTLGALLAAPARAAVPPRTRTPRPFTPADLSLIKSAHAFLPAGELLRVLNERLAADDDEAAPYPLAQLQAAVQAIVDASPRADWSGLRTLLAQARRSGVLRTITAQVVDDFAVVFRLSPAQRMTLKDVIQHAQEER
jgi:hypothetical protein